jgi:hypothetical protein
VFFQVDQNADLAALLIGDELDSAHGSIVLQGDGIGILALFSAPTTIGVPPVCSKECAALW